MLRPLRSLRARNPHSSRLAQGELRGGVIVVTFEAAIVADEFLCTMIDVVDCEIELCAMKAQRLAGHSQASSADQPLSGCILEEFPDA
jgi:hypothetical protein